MAPVIISVANRKGGTGKSTTAVHLAAGIARRGRRTLLIDLDTLGHAGLLLGLQAKPGSVTSHDLIAPAGGADLSPAVLGSPVQRLDVICADRNRGPGETGAKPLALRNLLFADENVNRYDAVVIDTAPAYDQSLVVALAASDAVLIPFVPHPLAVEGIRQFMRIALMIRMKLNPGLRSFGMVATQMNQQSALHRHVVESVRHEFGASRLVGAIRSDIQLARCAASHKPIYDLYPTSRGASDYELLTEAVMTGWFRTTEASYAEAAKSSVRV